MSAELLREAASKMRERAERIAEGPWEAGAIWNHGPELGVFCPEGDSWGRIADTETPYDAEHIASWHPAVALAVADWLEVVAARYYELQSSFPTDSPTGAVVAAGRTLGFDAALAVARAYLAGGDR